MGAGNYSLRVFHLPGDIEAFSGMVEYDLGSVKGQVCSQPIEISETDKRENICNILGEIQYAGGETRFGFIRWAPRNKQDNDIGLYLLFKTDKPQGDINGEYQGLHIILKEADKIYSTIQNWKAPKIVEAIEELVCKAEQKGKAYALLGEQPVLKAGLFKGGLHL